MWFCIFLECISKKISKVFFLFLRWRRLWRRQYFKHIVCFIQHGEIISKKVGCGINTNLNVGFINAGNLNNKSTWLFEFYDDQGKAERIKNTIFPHYYNYFTLFFLWLFTLSLPFALASIMDNWILIPISMAISFAFYILNKSGVLTETPFEGRASDIAISTICRGIEIDMLVVEIR